MRRNAMLLIASCVLVQAAGVCRAETPYYINPNLFTNKYNPRLVRPWAGNSVLPGKLAPVRSGIDPAAHSISFRVLSRTTQFRGRVEIAGVIKNVGSATYQSRSGAQLAYLYEDRRLVASKDFPQLAPGQEIKLTYGRNWDSSSPAEGEFPPTYKLMIVYDPDIAIDGNRQNDDVYSKNNRTERSGTAINALFR